MSDEKNMDTRQAQPEGQRPAALTLDEIRENTGFDLGVTGPVATTPAPTAEELRVLRSVVRPKMIETGTYAVWAERALGSG